MALQRNWRIFKYGGYLGDIRKECKTLDLRGCKRLTIKFDPFREDTKNIRDFNHLILSYYASRTNPNIIVKTVVLTDRSEHTVTADLIDGSKLHIKCANINVLDLFKILNEHVTPLSPKDEVTGDSAKEDNKLGKKGKKKK